MNGLMVEWWRINKFIYIFFIIVSLLSRYIEYIDTLVVNCVRQSGEIVITFTVCKAISKHFLDDYIRLITHL